MCVRYMKIRSKHRYAPKAAFIPCGQCEECRQSKNSQWFFRLRSELDWCWKHKWNIGFFTLTYSESKKPLLDLSCIKGRWRMEQDGVTEIPCFSRKHLRNFIDNIRKRLNEDYRISGIRYMICSEYGSEDYTARPHYHGLICFPSEYEKVDYDTGEVTTESLDPRIVFDLIHSQWRENGFVFPRKFEGGYDRHRYKHQPFLLQGDVSRAARYASKYTCKDIGYSELMAKYAVDTDSQAYKDGKPVHIQSRSIGLRWLENRSDEELLELMKNGESFVGDKFTRHPPLYIRNKILFDPYYVFEPCSCGDWWYDFGDDKWRFKQGEGTHKRLVRKRATDFFIRNIREIFARKVEYYKTLFEDMTTPTFWSFRGVPKNLSASPQSLISSFGAERLATAFLCYYGLPADKWRATTRPDLFYLSRYVPEMKFGSQKWTPAKSVNDRYIKHVLEAISSVVDCLKFAQPYDMVARAKAKRVGDYHKHME